jgi:hypothetical protein
MRCISFRQQKMDSVAEVEMLDIQVEANTLSYQRHQQMSTTTWYKFLIPLSLHRTSIYTQIYCTPFQPYSLTAKVEWATPIEESNYRGRDT